jgi:hypothetical protein
MARKTKSGEGQFIVMTTRSDTSYFLKEKIRDHYFMLSDSAFTIKRTFSNYRNPFAKKYTIDVKVMNKVNDIFELSVYSEILNLHKKVFSRTIVPICPIKKTVIYHPSCAIAKINYHNDTSDSTWNSRGDIII